MARGERPLSPHLQVYRPQITSVLSISHRASGVFLAAASLLLIYWLLAAASGPEAYAAAQGFFGHWLLRLVLIAASFGFFYHLCNGIRHLCWDAGWGYEIRQVIVSGWTVIIASLVLTLGFWLLVAA
ncbi:MAG: succinate dehydrogenase, cytochrome b556 subunit [Gammaproteobacteria bacterium]|nr:succinate dehydrogenase, cytochrome b556 subunit [Gammaproteobacteria bacterium]TVQ49634.1 MAG: succinate dehydrogenase, cytochrome b556 subunit [Gammaproteobacteria bacterium]